MNAFTSVEAGTPVSADAIGLPALARVCGALIDKTECTTLLEAVA